MKKVFLKSISVFLCIVCILGAVPLCASAAEVYAPVVSKDYEGLDYVDLTWNDTYPVDNYNVYLSSDGYNFSYYKSVFSNYTSIMDLPKGRYFAYVTSKTSSAGEYGEQESTPSNVVDFIIGDRSMQYIYTDYDENSGNINVSWSSYYNQGESADKYSDGYMVFMSQNGSEYKCVATISPNAFSSVNSRYYEYTYSYYTGKVPSKYSFAVCSFVSCGGVNYYQFDAQYAEDITVYLGELTLTTKTKSEKIKWKKYNCFDYYEIYQNDKCVAIVAGDKNSYTVKGVNNYKNDYNYYIKAYKNSICVSESYIATSDVGEARFRAAKKSKKKKNKVTVVNTRTKKNRTAWTVYLSNKDKKTLKKFAKKHFKKGWSDMQKAQYTLEWINKKVNYVKGAKFNKIAGLSYVDAIFNKKAGQCLQYNGAYAMMLTYLGYEARIVQGWRGTPKKKWSHYWCEIKIDGKWYLMETGHYKDSGDWSYFCATYRNAGGYMLNGKVAK